VVLWRKLSALGLSVNNMEFSKSSLAKLKGVHPDLVRVVMRCANDWDDEEFTFGITCGPRTLEEQKILVKKGASKTLRSRHIPAANGFAHAIDVVAMLDGKVRWDWPLYLKIANAMKAAAIVEKIPLEWGGTWSLLNSVKGSVTPQMLSKSFPDGPHYQLPKSTYP
jgi:peptidoglycan L-alanyl-D-glutamate endopeptidase CwlK